MDWKWVWWASTLPVVPALLVAWALWRTGASDNMGAIARSAVSLIGVVWFVAREYGEMNEFARRCDELQKFCRWWPEPFSRHAIFALIGMAQIFVLFGIDLKIAERRTRLRDYTPEWQR